MQRPTGITVLAILYFVSGGLSLATSCFAMVVGSWMTAAAARLGYVPSLLAPATAFRGEHAFWLGLIGTGAALLKVVAAAGLWTLQPWGWQLALIGGTLKLVTHLVAVMPGRDHPGRRRGRAGQRRRPRLPVHTARAAGALGRPGRRSDRRSDDDAAVTAEARRWGRGRA